MAIEPPVPPAIDIQAEDRIERSSRTLLPLVYDELRAIAASFFSRQRAGHTLQATALVNEAYLKLAQRTRDAWESESHFKAVAAKAMRQILVDHFRARQTDKRGGGAARLTFIENVAGAESLDVDLLALDEALVRLRTLDDRKAQVVELRFFGGLSIEQTAAVLGISHMTVSSDWRFAKAWLADAISGDGSTRKSS